MINVSILAYDISYTTIVNASRNIIGSFMEIGGVASPHWRKGLRLQLVFATCWVGQMRIGGHEDSNNNIHL